MCVILYTKRQSKPWIQELPPLPDQEGWKWAHFLDALLWISTLLYLIVLFSMIYFLFWIYSALHTQKTHLDRSLQAFSSRRPPTPPGFFKHFLTRESELANYRLLHRARLSGQTPETAPSFLIKYLFSGKVHVWSVYNKSRNLLSSIFSIKIL